VHLDPPSAPRRSRGWPGRLLALTLTFALGIAAPSTANAQAVDTVRVPDARPLPPDTWDSPGVRALLDRARETRDEGYAGLQRWDGRMWERVYVGLSAGLLRRERGLFEQEREARIRWSRDGERVVRWEGARRDVPIAGLTSAGDPEGMARSLARDLARTRLPPPLAYEPGSDRLFFGGDGMWALSPLADTAGHHYRFHEGDTLTLLLPEDGRRVVLTEVRVEPRRTDSRLVTASLWFDDRSGQLVRAGYRPARPFDLEMDQPAEAEDVPGIFLPIRAEIRYVTVDHALYDLEWWIPRRFAFEGEAQVGRLARFPVRFEWTVDELEVNEHVSELTDPDAPVPEGWTRVRNDDDDEEEEADPDRRRITVIAPPAEHLALNPPGVARPGGSLVSFRPEELERLEGELRSLLPPGAGGFPFRWSRGLEEGLTRYNRVEALSTGLAGEAMIAPELRVRGKARIGAADLEPGAELALMRTHGRRSDQVRAYRRLVPSADWGAPLSLGSSTNTLLFGGEHDPFHRAVGAELRRVVDDTRLRADTRLFVEAHRTARRGTHVHVGHLVQGRDLPDNPAAERGWWAGGATRLQWQSGVDPSRTQLLAETRLEAAGGTGSYGRGWASAALRVPVVPGWSGAVEAGGGTSVGNLPAQRRFFPGGSRIYRGERIGETAAEAFWFARTEVGRGPVGARISGFVDVRAAGPRESLFRVDPDVAVGLGASFLDGLLRVDLVRSLGDDGRLRLMAYFDGLL
jgi:hypothetical protein